MLVEVLPVYARPFQAAGRDPQQQNAKLAVAGWLAVLRPGSVHAQCSQCCTVPHILARARYCTAAIWCSTGWPPCLSPFPLFPFRRQVQALTRLSEGRGHACLRRDNRPPLSSAKHGYHKYLPLLTQLLFVCIYIRSTQHARPLRPFPKQAKESLGIQISLRYCVCSCSSHD